MPHDDHDTIDGDVYVSPRHLARSTAVSDPGLDPLRNLGWDLHHDHLGNAYLTAPDGKVRLGYLPEGDDDGLWRINAYKDAFGPPAWGVCFNDSAPTEFVTAFTPPSPRRTGRAQTATLPARLPEAPTVTRSRPLTRSSTEAGASTARI
ncbi:hypothetical protein SHO565_15290 [Streptomyces sp. HO565]